MTFHDQKKSNSMTFRTILGNEHIRSKYGNFKEQHNASFKPQIVNKTLLYGNLHITTHNINNKITEIKLKNMFFLHDIVESFSSMINVAFVIF